MSSTSPPSGFRKPFLQAALIILAGFWVFYPALHGGWLWDDELLIRHNAQVHDPAGLWQIWFQPGQLIDYFPMTVSVEWLEWQLWGDNTFAFHLANVVLHIVSGLLVWRLLCKFNLRLAWLGGLLFVVHPAVVESVAWISEIKNTLSLPPFLLAMCFWIDYDRSGKTTHYLAALGLFVVAMLCKTTMVMFPVLILTYAWWKRSRITWKDLKVSVPFFAISLGIGILTIVFFRAPTSDHAASPAARIVLAGQTLVFYFSKCVLPVRLMPIYPQWSVNPSSLAQWLPWPLFIAVFAACWLKRETWGRHAILGLGFFVINIAPFLGFNQAPYMDFTWVMDHILYLPLIGLIGLFVAAMEYLRDMLPRSPVPWLIVFVGAVVVLLAMGSRTYAAIYGDSLALWTYAVRGNPGSPVVRVSLGEALAQRDRISEAMEQFEAAIQINPASMNARDDLGKALNQLGRIPEAIAAFESELQVNPDDVNAAYSLGNIYVRLGQIPEATKWYRKAVQLNPRYFAADYALGCIFLESNQLPEAIEHLQKAQELDSSHAEVYSALGNALVKMNRLPEAIEQFQKAVDLLPHDASARCDLGVALARAGRMPEATEQFQNALQNDPGYFMAHYDLGSAFLAAGKLSDAIEEYKATLQLKPDFTPAQQGLEHMMLEKKHGATTP